jgi:hypothetical protein
VVAADPAEFLRRLAEALSLDIVTEGPLVIDVNPRLVEPMKCRTRERRSRPPDARWRLRTASQAEQRGAAACTRGGCC